MSPAVKPLISAIWVSWVGIKGMVTESYRMDIIQLQDVFATAVGLGLAFAFLVDLLGRLDSKLIDDAKLRIETLSNEQRVSDMLKLSNRVLAFQYTRGKQTENMMYVSIGLIVISVINFSLLVYSIVVVSHLLSKFEIFICVGLAALPYATALWFVSVWAVQYLGLKRNIARYV